MWLPTLVSRYILSANSSWQMRVRHMCLMRQTELISGVCWRRIPENRRCCHHQTAFWKDKFRSWRRLCWQRGLEENHTFSAGPEPSNGPSWGAVIQLSWEEETRRESPGSALAWRTLPPALTRTSAPGFPEAQLGGAQRTAVRAAPNAPEEGERREPDASTSSGPCVHAQASNQTYIHARAGIHALFCNRGRETADAE